MNWDRTVHASCDEFEVVRYDSAGHWYHEDSTGRMRVTLDRAATFALLCLTKSNGAIYFDLPGGSAFDRRVRGYQYVARHGIGDPS